MGVYRGPRIVSEGLILGIDLGSPRGGTTTAPKNLVNPSDALLPNALTVIDGIMHYNRSSSRIALPVDVVNTLEGTDEATFEFWLKADFITNGAGQAGLIQMSSLDATNGTLWLYSNQSIYLDTFRTARYTVSTNSQSWFTATDWHHLSVSTKLGASGYRVMINGVHRYANTGHTVAVANANYPPEIGRNSKSRDYGGDMGQFLLYNRALTDEEKIHNYEIGKKRYGL